MINLIGILILIIIISMGIVAIILYFEHKINILDNEVDERDKLLGKRTEMIKIRNKIILDKTLKIQELENEIKQLKRANRK